MQAPHAHSSRALPFLGWLMLASTASAFVEPPQRGFEVDVLASRTPAPKGDATPPPSTNAASAWRTWTRQHPGWWASWSPTSGAVRRAWGPGVHVASGRPTADSIERDCRALLARTAGWSGIDVERIRLVQAHLRMNRWYVVFEQVHGDLPVQGGRVDMRLSADGQLMLLGADWVDAVLGNDVRSLDVVTTFRVAQRDLPRPAARMQSHRALLVPVPTPGGTTLRLADEIVFRTDEPRRLWRCLVDARSGRLLQRRDQLRYVDVTGNVAAEVEPTSPFHASEVQPLQDTRINIGNGVTEFGFSDDAGDFSVSTAAAGSVDVFIEMSGPWARVHNSALGNATPRLDARILPGTPHDLLWDDSNSRASERTAYRHTLLAHDFIKELDPAFTGVDYAMPVVVDIGGNQCNAWYDGQGINFLQQGSQCVNTARIADVVFHEYGHAITDWQYRPFAPSGAMHEAFSDYLAATMRSNPLIGYGFYGPGTSIRSVQNTRRTPEDLSGEVHNDGLVLAGALWDMRTLIGIARADSLFHFARYGLADNFDDYLLDILVTDDDNGSIYDGTPNIDFIILAFEAHGIGDYSVSIQHEGLADSEDIDKPLDIDSSILSLFPLDTGSLTLHYRIDEGPWQSLPLQDRDGVRRFGVTLPAQAAGTIVDYRIEAADTQGHTARWPGPQQEHRIVIGPDTTPPVLAAQPLAHRPLDAPHWRLQAQVQDNLDRDVASVDLLWSLDDPVLDQILPLVRGDTDLWEAWIPPAGTALGDVVHYALVASDSASSTNVTRLPAAGAWSFRVVRGFLRDLEFDDGGFSASGEWQWGVPALGPEAAWSGDHVWATVLDGGYGNNVESILMLPPVDLSDWQSAALCLRSWHAFEGYYDGGVVEVSTDNGNHWQLLHPDGDYPWAYIEALNGPGYSGDSGGWQDACFDLSRYPEAVLLRLRFASDGGITDLGWVVDDVEVVERQLLAVPLRLRAADGADQRVPLRWRPPAGIDPLQAGTPLLGYNVWRGVSTDLSDAVRVNTMPIVSPAFEDGGVDNGTSYHYAVTAVYAEGESRRSRTASALPYRAVYAAELQQLVLEASAGVGVDTAVTFANQGTGFLRLNAWVGDPGQGLDDVRIAWGQDLPSVTKAHRVPAGSRETARPRPTPLQLWQDMRQALPSSSKPRSSRRPSPRAQEQVPNYTVVFTDPDDAGSPVDLREFGVAQENGLIYFRLTGHQTWGNILSDFTLIVSIDTDADRGSGDDTGADHYVLVGAFPMQVVGVPAFVSNTNQEIVGIASYVVVPMDADVMEVGLPLALLGEDVGRLFLSATALTPDLGQPLDVLPNPPASGSWLTLVDLSVSATPGVPGRLPLGLAPGLSPAAYEARLLLDTNDPDATEVVLPVHFLSGVTPITLFDLQAVQERHAVLLSWRTGSETGVRAYRVFRARDGGAFEALRPEVRLEDSRHYAFRDLPPGPGSYAYRIGEVTHAGDVVLHGMARIDVARAVPRQAFLDPNVPNPFNPRTRLAFGVDRDGPVRLEIFDARGRRVRTLLATQQLPAGYHESIWDGRDDRGRAVASGVYHARLVVDGRAMSRRLTLLK